MNQNKPSYELLEQANNAKHLFNKQLSEKLKDKLMIMKDDFIENPSIGEYIDEIIEEVESEDNYKTLKQDLEKLVRFYGNTHSWVYGSEGSELAREIASKHGIKMEEQQDDQGKNF